MWYREFWVRDYEIKLLEPVQTIDFGNTPQTVSADFYNWLLANANHASASIIYNGETIVNLFPGQTATLKCTGMKMTGDVVVATV